MNTLGHEIRAARKHNGMSQHDLARELNKITNGNATFMTISNYERGEKEPTADIILALAHVLQADDIRWLALGHRIHPRIEQALERPSMAKRIYELVTEG